MLYSTKYNNVDKLIFITEISNWTKIFYNICNKYNTVCSSLLYKLLFCVSFIQFSVCVYKDTSHCQVNNNTDTHWTESLQLLPYTTHNFSMETLACLKQLQIICIWMVGCTLLHIYCWYRVCVCRCKTFTNFTKSTFVFIQMKKILFMQFEINWHHVEDD